MINHNDLTGQGTITRNRLITAIIEKWGSAEPWFDGWSPDHAVFDTMIRENEIHLELRPSIKSTLHKPWSETLKKLQGAGNAVKLEDIYRVWKTSPFGMKNGTMPILALMMIM